eukprot:266134-Amorphochlora_amoeboformis.AAC.4
MEYAEQRGETPTQHPSNIAIHHPNSRHQSLKNVKCRVIPQPRRSPYHTASKFPTPETLFPRLGLGIWAGS